MKNIVFITVLLISLLAGCTGSKQVIMSGESESWEGEYRATIEDNSEQGEYKFRFKDGDEDTEFSSYDIQIGENREAGLSDTGTYIGSVFTMSSGCSGCAVTYPDDPIEITIKWNGTNEETFLLKQE